MAHIRSFVYRIRLTGETCATEFAVEAFGRGEADTLAYSEACRLGAKTGNVTEFDCVRVEAV